MTNIVQKSGSKQEAASPVEEVASLGEDAVLRDPEAQRRAEHHHHRQQQVEVLPEYGVTHEPGRQVRQDHQHRVEEHLGPRTKTSDNLT